MNVFMMTVPSETHANMRLPDMRRAQSLWILGHSQKDFLSRASYML
jgi:hypothetical protein